MRAIFSYIIKYTLIIASLCLLNHYALGQPKNIRFRSISVEEGLSSNNVLSILQDHQGLMWIGTGYGLNSYDSYDFQYFNNDRNDSLSISDDVISAIYQDSRNRLWLGTGNGINLYNQEKGYFTRFTDNIENDLTSKYIRTFFEDSRDELWVGTSKGLYRFSEKQNKFIPFEGDSNEDLRINTISEDGEGRLLIGTIKGLYYVRDKKFEPVHLTDKNLDNILNHAEIRSIQQDTGENLWIATEGKGLFVVDKTCHATQYTVSNTNEKLLSDKVRVIKITSKGDIWIGTRDGLNIYYPENHTFASYQHNKYDQNSLSFNSIRDIFEDNTGGIWLATSAGGLNYYNPANNLFNLVNQKLGVENTLNYNQIKAIAMTGNNLWLGTTGRGINLYNLKENTFTYYIHEKNKNSLVNDDIKSIALDSMGNLWIGTYDGISYFNTSTKQFKNYSLTSIDPLNPVINQVHTTLIDYKGNLWAGTNGAGLIFFDLLHGGHKQYIHKKNEPKSLVTNHIDVLFEDSKHNIWVGTRLGLDILSNSDTSFIHTALDDIKTQSIREDKDGNIWIGTKGQGLYLYDDKKDTYINFKVKDGLPGNVIRSILEDAQGNLWMSTNNGLAKMIVSRDNKGKFLDAEFVNYKKSDGLQGNQFFQGSAFKSSSGKLFFGGINGLNYFDPQNVPPEIDFFPVLLTDLKIKNQDVVLDSKDSPLDRKINYANEIQLAYDQSEFTIEFAALNYWSPNKSVYAYKLEGFDKDWNYIGKQRNATFTYPSHGDYVFKIKSSTSPDKWPETYTSIKIHILPPIWKQNWAYGLYVFCFLLLLYIYHRISSNFSKLKREEELTKSKFEFFTNISHEIKTPLTLILAPLEGLIQSHEGDAKIHNQLTMMKRNGDRLIHLINQLLDYRKFESGAMQLQTARGNIVKFVKEIFLSFKTLSEKKNIDFQFHAPEYIELWYDRDKLEKVLLNLLSNAFKFTEEGGKIVIKLVEHENKHTKKFKCGYCNIKIEDTGTGIPPGKLKSIFKRFVSDENYPAEHTGTGIGLNLAKRLVNIHSGDILVKSGTGDEKKQSFTSFTVRLPLGYKHLKEKQIVKDFKDSEQISQYVQAEAQLVNPKKALAHSEKPSKKDKIMLIVEDNTDVRKFVRAMFDEDFKVYEAANGDEGKLKAFEVIPDIIISDVMMPGTDGITLCSTLKDDHRTSHIPIILLTARTPLIFRVEGIETGADDYVTKPFSTVYLKSRVRNLILNREKIKEKFRKELILQPQKLTITSPDEKFLEGVLRYLEKNMDNSELSVEDIGREIGMSRSNLYRKIKALTGLTIVEFVRSIRIKRAAQLLKESDLNVNEVAYSVGFQDVDYFRRCFKEEFKVAPSKYMPSLSN